ncbi:hypothetical protein LP420_03580 [Massilia sp. B-10]|nr:hypothetical protein LP420_03580 [Massilia sp. B-10]
MSPDARQADQYRTPLRRELADYLSVSGSRLSMAEAAGLAVRAWIAADRAGSEERAGSGDGSLPAARGYLWKTVFLPHATVLRMLHEGQSHLAEVVGDHIIHRGVSVSPRGMTLAIAGEVHALAQATPPAPAASPVLTPAIRRRTARGQTPAQVRYSPRLLRFRLTCRPICCAQKKRPPK